MKHKFSRQQRLAAMTLTLTGLILSLFAGLPVTDPLRSNDSVIAVKPPITESISQQVAETYGKLPLAFEANAGQTDAAVKFTSHGSGYSFFLTANEAVMQLRQPDKASGQASKSAMLKMRFAGANSNSTVTGEELLPGKSNFFIGRDSSRWQTDVPNFARVRYDEFYPGVDLVFYGNQRQLEYDFVVAPGADPRQIRLNFEGADQVALDEQGNLKLMTDSGDVIQRAPVIYQQTVEGKRFVTGGYALMGENQVAFQLGDYDAGLPLVIDPVLNYSTYLGGSATDGALSVVVDAAGQAYVFGKAVSANFPTTNTINFGPFDTFVTKLNAAGTNIVYSTMIHGGMPLHFSPLGGIAVDEAGNAYIAGGTSSEDFPLVSPFQDEINAGRCIVPIMTCIVQNHLAGIEDGYVLKLNPAGNAILFSTYLGANGSDVAHGIAVSADHKVYVVGTTDSTRFTTTNNRFQGDGSGTGKNAFLTVFAADGQSLVYSTYFRTGQDDEGRGVAVDAAGNAYIVGSADGTSLSTKGAGGAAPFQADRAGGTDAFVAKFNPAASGDASLIYATYLGGSGTDVAFAIAVDNQNQAYVTGVTGSPNFPLQAAAGASVLDSTNQVNEAFVTCLNANGSGAIFSTFLGGAGVEEGLAITLDRNRNIIVAGDTTSSDFSRVSATQQTIGGGRDAFVTKIAAGGMAIRFSTFLGGSGNDFARGVATDGAGNIYLAGDTSSTNFPVTPGVIQTAAQGSGDGFVAKIAFANPDTPGTFTNDVAIFGLSNTLSPPNQDITVFFGQALSRPIAGDWDGDGVTTVGAFKNGVFQLTNTFTPTPADVITINFGQAGDIPVAGDWDGDGVDTIGVFRPAAPHQAAQFLLRLHNNTSTLPRNQAVFNFGTFSDLPVVGDWDGDGVDTVGVFHGGVVALPGEFRLVNENSDSATILTVNFGISGELPVAGDWDGDGVDTVGVFKNGTFRLRLHDNNSTAANNNLTTTLVVNSDFPLAGDWNGQP